MKDYLISKDIDAKRVFVTGIPLSSRFLQKYDRNEILNSYGLKDGKQNILFFGGGEFGLGKSRTFEVFDALVQCTLDKQIIAIAGKNEKMKAKFDEIVEKNNASKRVRVLSFTNEVPELMSISDLVVTKPGGMTTTESLASHLPLIMINPIPGQEEENAKFLESKGVGVWLKKESSVSDVLSSLFSFPERLQRMKQNTLLLGNPNSTRDICEILCL